MTAEPRLPGDPDVLPRAAEPELPSDGSRPAQGVPNTPPHAGPNAASSVAPGASDARAERIRRATARGPLGGHVPAAYEDEDWETVRSPNPFEVLYLDYQQPGAIGAAVLDDRRQTLHAFWKQKDDVRSRNAGGQRERIDRKYGFEVGTYAGLVERAYRRLAEPGALAREAQALDDARRGRGERELQRLIRSCLADGLLTVEETETLLQEGDAVGLTREETADYVSRVLAEQRFTERDARRGETLSAVLLSTEWLSAERRAREDAAAARAAERAADARVTPIEFNNGSAQTLAQLVDLCDRYPAEAQTYLASGALEQWLGRAGKAAAVVEAGDRRRAYPNDRAKALELFVRDLSRRVGRPAAPVVVPEPAECAFGPLPQGARRRARIELAREGRPLVWGTTHFTHELPGVRASRAFAADPTDRAASVDVAVDTTRDAPGDYVTHLLVEPEGGERVAVPVRYTVLPLTLTTDRPALDLGRIPLGQTRTAAVRLIASPPGGRLVGVVSLSAGRDGVVLRGEVQDDGGTAQLTVDSRLTGPGLQYQSEIRFETNAGVVRVPVSFRVRRASAEVARWAGSFAVAGGAGMWAVRQALFPGEGWHLRYAWTSHAPSVVVAGVALSVVGGLARALLPRARKR